MSPKRKRRAEGTDGTSGASKSAGGLSTHTAAAGPTDAKLAARSGRGVAEWFEILDAEDATRLSHAQIVDLLVEVYEAPDWGAESVAVRYQREHGIRLPGEQVDGTFAVAASRSIRGGQLELLESALAAAATLGAADPAEVHRQSERCLAVWLLESGDRLEARVGAPRDGRCAVTFEESRIRLPERVSDLRRRLERAIERVAADPIP